MDNTYTIVCTDICSAKYIILLTGIWIGYLITEIYRKLKIYYKKGR